MDASQPQEAQAPGMDARVIETDLEVLRGALESAGELSPDERLELLRRAEASIAQALEGLDGL